MSSPQTTDLINRYVAAARASKAKRTPEQVAADEARDKRLMREHMRELRRGEDE